MLHTAPADPIGYESAHFPPRDPGAETARQSLRDIFRAAMRGERKLVPHVEHRCDGDVVALCPYAEALGEALDSHAVHHALIDLLRDDQSSQAEALRERLANRYAAINADGITRRGAPPLPQVIVLDGEFGAAAWRSALNSREGAAA